MKITLTKSELLKYRRRIGGLESLRTDCSIEQSDGIDIDAILSDKLRQWYLNLLDTADPRYLAPEDISPEIKLSINTDIPLISEIHPEEKHVKITLPDKCRRLLSIRLCDWTVPSVIYTSDRLRHVLDRQANPYTRATPSTPVAVLLPTAAVGHPAEAILYPAPGKIEIAEPIISEAFAAIDNGSDSYTFDDSALGLLPPDDILLNL